MPKTNALNSKAFQSISLVEALFHCLYTTTTFKRPFRVRYCSKNKLNKTECFQLSVRRFCYRLNGMDQAWPLTQFYVCFLYKIIWRRYFPFTHSRTSFLLVSDSCRFLFSADTTPFMGPQPCMWPPLELSTQKIKLHSVYFAGNTPFVWKKSVTKIGITIYISISISSKMLALFIG